MAVFGFGQGVSSNLEMIDLQSHKQYCGGYSISIQEKEKGFVCEAILGK